jgi:hypothetical protein
MILGHLCSFSSVASFLLTTFSSSLLNDGWFFRIFLAFSTQLWNAV